jgi:N-methylhydantoinase B
LTVDGDHIILAFEGASPQTDHYFNSKPNIIAAEFVVMLAHRMARDLPFNEGIFTPIELRCPEGTIVNANPPAPIAAAYMHVDLNAADVAMQALNLALGALPESPARQMEGKALFITPTSPRLVGAVRCPIARPKEARSEADADEVLEAIRANRSLRPAATPP